MPISLPHRPPNPPPPRVYGHTPTAVHDMRIPPLPSLPPLLTFASTLPPLLTFASTMQYPHESEVSSLRSASPPSQSCWSVTQSPARRMSPTRRKVSKQTARGRGNNADGYIDRSMVGFEAGEGDPPPLRNHTGLITDESYSTRTDGNAFESDSGDIFLDESVDEEVEWEASGDKR